MTQESSEGQESFIAIGRLFAAFFFGVVGVSLSVSALFAHLLKLPDWVPLSLGALGTVLLIAAVRFYRKAT